jgi:capsular polysaccharide biosynthesis protein
LFSLLFLRCVRTRRFVNEDEIVCSVKKLGFEVVVSGGTHEVASFTEITNSYNAIMGVHDAGLTNMVFLPPGGVMIQIVLLDGLEFVAS